MVLNKKIGNPPRHVADHIGALDDMRHQVKIRHGHRHATAEAFLGQHLVHDPPIVGRQRHQHVRRRHIGVERQRTVWIQQRVISPHDAQIPVGV